MKTADLVVIGSGPGGYVACLRAAQLGMKVACIESRATLGGTCLNVGCIPSKALLHSSHLYDEVCSHGDEHGFEFGTVKLHLQKMMARKSAIVAKNTSGIEHLFKSHNIQHIQGHGFFAPNSVAANHHRITSIKHDDGTITQITSPHVIIATGSIPRELPNLSPFDHDIICSSEDALSFKSVPKKLAVIGGGVIGLELGSVWHRLGAQVEVFESTAQLLPTMDPSLSKYILKTLKKSGLKFHLNTTVTAIHTTKQPATVTYTPSGQKSQSSHFDKVLICVGRVPNTQKLGLEHLQAQPLTDSNHRLIVDARFATKAPGIYAIGDAIQGPMLAHKAEAEGIAVAELLANEPAYINYHTIPHVVYTWPELAAVGLTQQELSQQKIPVKTATFSLRGNARSKVWGEDSGFVKLYSEQDTGQLLGAHLACPHASELIAEIGVAMNFQATAEDIYRTTHAHPSISEAIKEAALGCDGRTLHS